MYWYLKALKQYADFNGRARRTEYWMFVLFNVIFTLLALILDNVLGLTIGGLPYGAFYFLYSFTVLIPGLAVAVRRLHDVGKSGWMILISLIPIIGGIWLLVLMCTEGDADENEYGPNPKEVGEPEAVSGDSSDKILLFVIGWMVVSRLYWAITTRFIDNYYSTEWFRFVNAFTNLIWAVTPIGLAFAVKDKSKRPLLFVIGGLYLAYGIFEAVTQLMNGY